MTEAAITAIEIFVALAVSGLGPALALAIVACADMMRGK